jgi:radical SAM superfamily enzyme YgiQ (UPF0313 family)
MSEKKHIVCLAIHSNIKQNMGMPKWSHSLAFAFLRAYFTTSPHYDGFLWQDFNRYENDDTQQIAQELMEIKPDVLAISCYVWNIERVRELLVTIQPDKGEMTIILGGPEMNEFSDSWLDDAYGVDHIVVGEGEITFRELLEHLHAGSKTELADIHGLLYRDATGTVQKNPLREKIRNLDIIPSPYLLGLIPIEIIHNGLIGLETQRGCILDCAFCNYQKGFRSVRFFALERVLEEVELIVSNQPRQLNLMDPTFNSNRKRAKAILKKIIASKPPGQEIFVNAEMVPDILDEEMISLAKQAGFNYFELGIQSLNPKAIDSMGRYRNEDKLFNNIKTAIDNDLRVVPHLIFGLPGDTLVTFLDSFNRIYRMPTEDLTLMQLLLLPGTRFRNEAESLGIEFNPQAPYEILQSRDFSRADIQLLEKMTNLVLITQPMKLCLVKIIKISAINAGDIFLNFINNCSDNLLDFNWPLLEKNDKVSAMQAIEEFHGFVCELLPDDLDAEKKQEILRQLGQLKRSSQIVLV